MSNETNARHTHLALSVGTFVSAMSVAQGLDFTGQVDWFATLACTGLGLYLIAAIFENHAVMLHGKACCRIYWDMLFAALFYVAFLFTFHAAFSHAWKLALGGLIALSLVIFAWNSMHYRSKWNASYIGAKLDLVRQNFAHGVVAVLAAVGLCIPNEFGPWLFIGAVSVLLVLYVPFNRSIFDQFHIEGTL